LDDGSFYWDWFRAVLAWKKTGEVGKRNGDPPFWVYIKPAYWKINTPTLVQSLTIGYNYFQSLVLFSSFSSLSYQFFNPSSGSFNFQPKLFQPWMH
jgi:hypothetical protein